MPEQFKDYLLETQATVVMGTLQHNTLNTNTTTHTRAAYDGHHVIKHDEISRARDPKHTRVHSLVFVLLCPSWWIHSPLYKGIVRGHLPVVREFFKFLKEEKEDSIAAFNWNPLLWAVNAGHVEIVKLSFSTTQCVTQCSCIHKV